MKRIIAALLAVCMLFALCACSSDGESGSKKEKEKVTDEAESDNPFVGKWKCTLDISASLVKFVHDRSMGVGELTCECLWEFTEDEYKITILEAPSYNQVIQELQDSDNYHIDIDEAAEGFMEKYAAGSVAFSGPYEIDDDVINIGELYKFSAEGDIVSLRWYDPEDEDGGKIPHFYKAKLKRVDSDFDIEEHINYETEKPEELEVEPWAIKGEWECELGFVELLKMLGVTNVYGLDVDGSVYMYLDFDDDEMFMYFDDDAYEDCVEEFIDMYVGYISDGGLEAIAEMYDCSVSEAEEMLEEEDMDLDDFLEYIEEYLTDYFDEAEEQIIGGASVDYTFDGKTVEFENSGTMEVEIRGGKMTVKSASDNDFLEGIEGKSFKKTDI